MKEAGLLIIFVLIFVSLLTYGNLQLSMEPPENANSRLTLNLSSDKEVYHSSEEMKLETMIETSAKVENLTIKVYGIKDSAGRFRVSGEKVVNINPPGTSETFSFLMPSCYGCAGVSPGEYEIKFEVIKDGEIIGNFSKSVKLEG